jgi:hypothetical protein
MSNRNEQPLPTSQADPSSPLSDAPSVLLPPTSDSSSSSSLIPDTPSRSRRKDSDRRFSLSTGNDTEDDNEDDDNNGNNNEDNEDPGNLRPVLQGLNEPTNVPLTREDKLNDIVRALRRTNWTFEDMIKAWVGCSGPQDIRVQHHRYHKQRQRRSAMIRAMRSLADYGVCQEVSLVKRCLSELNALVSRAPFSKFAVDISLETIDDAQAAAVVLEVAPTWHTLLSRLLSNRRHHRATYGAPNNRANIQRRMFAITSMVCFSRARQASNTLSTCLDIYLVGSGVHRRVIETLQGLGLCHSYHHANSVMQQVAKHAAVRKCSVNPCLG